MDDILSKQINEMAQCEFECSCGKKHNFTVHDIAICKGAINKLPEIAKDFKEDKILIVFDNNTYKAAGKRAVEVLKNAGFNDIDELLFDTGDDILLPKEETFGSIISKIDRDCKLVIAVGGGVINDSVKFVTSRAKLPFIIVGTAPSMDGYVSDNASIFSCNKKLSVQTHLTYAVVGDTEVLQTAPQDLIQAGFGDVVGKITALADWDLAVKIKGDYRCDTCVKLVQNALDKCFSTCDGLKTRNEESLGALMEALTLTGVAMALINVSRPASGSEHLLSHYWEMDYIARGLNPNHHGVQVGVASPVVARLYEELQDILPDGVFDWVKPHEEVEDLLLRAGAPISPKEIGIEKDLFYNSLLEGHEVREKYTALRFAVENNRMKQIAEKITEEIYS